jgi:hypothetical protein
MTLIKLHPVEAEIAIEHDKRQSNSEPEAASATVPPVDIPANKVAALKVAALPVSPVSSTEAHKKFVAETVAAFGPTVRHMPSGKTELNLATMSRILARRLGIVWDVAAREFLQKGPDKTYQPVAPEYVINLVSETLQRIAAIHHGMFPLKELRPARVKKLVDQMKLITSQVRPDTRQSLAEYVRNRLCRKPSHNVTVEEVFADFLEYERRQNKPLFSRAMFRREIPRMILEQFAITKVNNLLRKVDRTTQPTAHRGFNGVTFRTDVLDVSDTKVATEALANPS